MPDANEPRDAALDQAALQLSDGLKNCRKVVEGYRAALLESVEQAGEPANASEQVATRPADAEPTKI